MFHLFPASDNKTGNTLYVPSGLVVCSRKGETLVSTPLGSCIAVVAYAPHLRTGGMAHIMLPGKPSGKEKGEKTKYAEYAIDHLLNQLFRWGAAQDKTEICLVGGANVLRKKNDIIAIPLILNVLEIIKKKQLSLKATSMGGYERRTAMLDLSTGKVCYTLGDSGMKTLWQFGQPAEQLHCREKPPSHSVHF